MSLFAPYVALRDACVAFERLRPGFTGTCEALVLQAFEEAELALARGGGGSELDALADDLRKVCSVLDRDPTDIRAFAVLWGTLRALDNRLRLADLAVLEIPDGVILVGRRFWNAFGEFVDPPAFDVPVLSEWQLLYVRHRGASAPSGLVGGPSVRFERARRDGALRIALSGLPCDLITTFVPTRITEPLAPRRTLGFISDSVLGATSSGPTQAAYLDTLTDVARQALADHVDVLALPELSVCDAGLAHLAERLSLGSDPPTMVVAGSFHRGSDAQVQNRAPILIWNSGARHYSPPIEYDKSQPWADSCARLQPGGGLSAVLAQAKLDHAHRVCEDIDLTQMKRLVAVKTPLGVFSVCICLDALDPALLERLHGITDHLVIVSMNSSPAAGFFPGARALAARSWTATYYVNASQAVHSVTPVDGAFWYLPTLGKHPRVKKSHRLRFRRPNGGPPVSGAVDLPAPSWTVCSIPTPSDLWPKDYL